MKPEIKQQWVDALRSGDYTQGKGMLTQYDYNQDGSKVRMDCCLGVLCDLAVKAGVVPKPKITGDDEGGVPHLAYNDGDAYNDQYLPAEVMNWADIDDNDPKVAIKYEDVNTDHFSTLSGLNDEGHSFIEIAMVIEKQL